MRLRGPGTPACPLPADPRSLCAPQRRQNAALLRSANQIKARQIVVYCASAEAQCVTGITRSVAAVQNLQDDTRWISSSAKRPVLVTKELSHACSRAGRNFSTNRGGECLPFSSKQATACDAARDCSFRLITSKPVKARTLPNDRPGAMSDALPAQGSRAG